jgi:hypothetical protein
MKVEISALFGMDYSDDMVRDIHVGDGVHLQEIKLNGNIHALFQKVKSSNENDHRALAVREKHEWHRYTHRFFISVDETSSLDSEEVSQAKQLVMRAIVLSRIVKPMPIPLHPTVIYAVHNDSGEAEYSAEINMGFYSTAYLARQKRKQSISQGEAELMAKYWPASQHIYDNRDKYRRIYRSLMTFNDAYHIRPSNISHVILHAALESLICTSPFNNKRQVTKRLPQLVQGVTEDQAVDIYDFCCDVKHAAAPGLLYSKGVREMDPRDGRRYEAVERLETSLRALFIRALEDRSFAEELEDKKVLAQRYPVPKK